MPGPAAGPGGGGGADPEEGYDFLFKLVLIGDASVGKTCLVQRFKTGAFAERQGSTIGVDFTMKSLEIQGKRVKVSGGPSAPRGSPRPRSRARPGPARSLGPLLRSSPAVSRQGQSRAPEAPPGPPGPGSGRWGSPALSRRCRGRSPAVCPAGRWGRLGGAGERLAAEPPRQLALRRGVSQQVRLLRLSDLNKSTLNLASACLRLVEIVRIWDTAGQERFRTITQSYYRSANGAILAYDISKRGSFLSIPRWIEDVRKYAGSNIVQLLIGNKSDLSDLREVQLEEAQNLAERYDNIICAIETSAKDSSNVEEAFVKMATELMMRHGGPMFTGYSRNGHCRHRERQESSYTLLDKFSLPSPLEATNCIFKTRE
ncbi:Ras-related protein Rab-43 [Aix galericulata]|nr:Ras-related protein Rab-43 [Aix galericulata]